MNPYSATDIVRTLRSTYGIQETESEFLAERPEPRRWYTRLIRRRR